jgi:hypothetical protein
LVDRLNPGLCAIRHELVAKAGVDPNDGSRMATFDLVGVGRSLAMQADREGSAIMRILRWLKFYWRLCRKRRAFEPGGLAGIGPGHQLRQERKIDRHPRRELAVAVTGTGAPERAQHPTAGGCAIVPSSRSFPTAVAAMEVATLTFADVQRTAATTDEGHLFRPVNRGGCVTGECLGEKVVWQTLNKSSFRESCQKRDYRLTTIRSQSR